MQDVDFINWYKSCGMSDKNAQALLEACNKFKDGGFVSNTHQKADRAKKIFSYFKDKSHF